MMKLFVVIALVSAMSMVRADNGINGSDDYGFEKLKKRSEAPFGEAILKLNPGKILNMTTIEKNTCDISTANFTYYAALSAQDFGNDTSKDSPKCGDCIRVFVGFTSIALNVVGTSDLCNVGDLMLSPSAYAILFDSSNASQTSNWQKVGPEECNPELFTVREPMYTLPTAEPMPNSAEHAEMKHGSEHSSIDHIASNYFSSAISRHAIKHFPVLVLMFLHTLY